MPDSHSKSLTSPLAALLRDSALVWRGAETAHPKTKPTGFRELDERLPGGGWPIGNLMNSAPGFPITSVRPATWKSACGTPSNVSRQVPGRTLHQRRSVEASWNLNPYGTDRSATIKSAIRRV